MIIQEKEKEEKRKKKKNWEKNCCLFLKKI
jgi:hypothetical protein